MLSQCGLGGGPRGLWRAILGAGADFSVHSIYERVARAKSTDSTLRRVDAKEATSSARRPIPRSLVPRPYFTRAGGLLGGVAFLFTRDRRSRWLSTSTRSAS